MLTKLSVSAKKPAASRTTGTSALQSEKLGFKKFMVNELYPVEGGGDFRIPVEIAEATELNALFQAAERGDASAKAQVERLQAG